MAWDDDGADPAAWRLFGSIGKFRIVSEEIAELILVGFSHS